MFGAATHVAPPGTESSKGPCVSRPALGILETRTLALMAMFAFAGRTRFEWLNKITETTTAIEGGKKDEFRQQKECGQESE